MKAIRLDLSLPFPASLITQRFGENPELYARFGLSGHNGIDYGVPCGTPVPCAAAGMVTAAASDPQGYGNYVKISHAGFVTLYGHLQQALVWPGQEVARLEAIGLSGSTGFSSGPHLHFELRVAGKAIDPLADSQPPADPQVPAPAQPAGTAWLAPGKTARVSAAAGLNVRLGPGGRVVGVLPQGTLLSITRIEPPGTGAWCGVTLWVNGAFLKPEGEKE